MAFRIGVHHQNGKPDYSTLIDDWGEANSMARETSTDDDVAKVYVNCGGVIQRIYRSGRQSAYLKVRPTARCAHGNH